MTSSETFGLVIFDMDGVLVDSEILSCRAFSRSMAKHGVEISEHEIHDRFIGVSSRDSILSLLGPDLSEDELSAIILEVRDDAMRSFEGNLQPIADAVEVVADLAVAAAVASSSSPERISGSLAMTGLHDLLSPNFFSASMVERGKPAPDLFLLAAKTMSVAPDRCLVVEDSAAGVKAGKAAGMTVVGFTGGSHISAGYDAKLSAAGADLITDRLKDVHHIVAGGPKQAAAG